MAWVIDPSLITAVPMHIDIELHGALTRGMTVCDYRHLRGTVPAVDLERTPTMGYRGEEPNAEAALELDFPGFVDLLNSTPRKLRLSLAPEQPLHRRPATPTPSGRPAVSRLNHRPPPCE